MNLASFDLTRSQLPTTSPSTVGAVVVAAFLAVLAVGLVDGVARTDQIDPNPSTAAGRTSWNTGWEAAGPTDIEDFAADWERAMTSRYVLSGVIVRQALSSDQSMYGDSQRADSPATTEGGIAMPVHRAQLDDQHAVFQVGGNATVTDPVNGRRDCQKQTDGFWCNTGTEVSGSTDDRPAASSAAAQSVTGENATYRLYLLTDFEASDLVVAPGIDRLDAVAPQRRCWEVRSLTGDHGHDWGRRSQFCFDAETGALVLSRTFGQYRTETFVARQLSVDVLLSDLDPR